MFIPANEPLRKLDLPDNVLLNILLLLGQFSIIKYQMLSRQWHCRINHLFSNMCNNLEKGFHNMYSDYLKIVGKKLVYTPT